MTDYIVSVNGDDSNPGTTARPWRTVQHAVNKISAGDSVLVRNGVYHEQVIFPQGGLPGIPKYLKNYPGEKPIIDGKVGQGAPNAGLPRGKVRIDVPEQFTQKSPFEPWPLNQLGWVSAGLLDFPSVSNWTLEGIEARNSLGLGIRVWAEEGDVRNLTFVNCEIHFCRGAVASHLSSRHRTGYSITDITYTGCKLYLGQMDGPYWRDAKLHNWGAGMGFNDCQKVIVEYCDIWGLMGEGVMVQEARPVVDEYGKVYTCEDVIIQNNRIGNCLKGKIVVMGSRLVSVANNYVYDNDRYPDGTPSIRKSPGITIQTVEPQQTKPGTADVGCRDILVYGNRVDNVLIGMNVRGLPYRLSSDVRIFANTITNSETVCVSGFHPNSWRGSNIFKNNILHRKDGTSGNIVSSKAGELGPDPSWDISNNFYTKKPSAVGFDKRAVYGDPMLDDYFRPIEGSPCIGAADSDWVPFYDPNGTDRTPTIGAFEPESRVEPPVDPPVDPPVGILEFHETHYSGEPIFGRGLDTYTIKKPSLDDQGTWISNIYPLKEGDVRLYFGVSGDEAAERTFVVYFNEGAYVRSQRLVSGDSIVNFDDADSFRIDLRIHNGMTGEGTWENVVLDTIPVDPPVDPPDPEPNMVPADTIVRMVVQVGMVVKTFETTVGELVDEAP